MSTNRRVLLQGTAASLVFAPAVLRVTRAGAAEYSFKMANNTPESHPLSIRMREAAANILKESDGKVDIQVFPNNQLGSDTDMLSQLRSGALEFFTISGLILATLVPAASINGIGFAWSGYDKVWPAMDGELGAYIRAQIAKANLHTFEKIWENGFRQITSSTREIKTPEDLKGFKIRVPASPLWTSMFKAFDASPMTINFSEVYSALQTKVAEGQENPLALIDSAKLYEVQKYLARTNHMWDGYWLIANGRVWASIPDNLKAVITKNVNASGMVQRDDIAKLNKSVEAALTSKGMIFNNVDTGAFRAKLQSAGFFKEWKGKYGDDAWAILEKYAGTIS
ncbi:MAG: TRAP-type transport system periplasmic protein [Methylobacteriaceae bacterium]|jgi:tripartite ATP-independent transporter DctP family solute receptor|nr:TRAP-type transport system periplasmic protein [Methylobacteriaceae bacterium]